MNEFEVLAYKINNCNNQTEIDDVINNWDLNQANFNKWVELTYDNVDKLNVDKIPFLLDGLYRNQNEMKFVFFCIILELTYREIDDYILGFEKYKISKEKYKHLIPTFVEILSRQDSDIVDNILLVMLTYDSHGNLFDLEQRKKVIDGINKEIDTILEYLEEFKKADNGIDYSIGILLDYATYVNDKKTIQKVMDLQKYIYEMNIDATEFLLKFKSANNMGISEDELRVDAINKMCRWLEHPSELGKKPYAIKLTNEFKYLDDAICYILKYKKDINGKWLLGIVSDSGTFSEMQEYHLETEIKDSKIILQKLIDYWKARAN